MLVLFLLFQPLALFGQGLFQVEVYEPEEYANFRQNWAAAQDSSGRMFFANSAGLVTFDGESWFSTHDPAGETILSLEAHQSEIHWGGIGDFGMIRADSLNRLGPHSLKSQTDSTHHNFSTVWRLVSDGRSLHHEISEGFYSYREDSVQVLPYDERILGVFEWQGRVIVQVYNQGLTYLKGEKLQPIENSGSYAEDKIYVALPHDEGLLLVSREQGMVRYDGRDFYPIQTDASGYLSSQGVYRGIVLDESRYAFATLRGGIVITDRAGNLQQTLTEENGLHTDQTTNLYLDAEQTLWITTEYGIAKMLVHNPVTVYNEVNGFEGNPLFIERFDGETIVGTTAGLFRMDASGDLSRFEGTDDRFLDAVKTGDTLLITAAGGIYQLQNGMLQKIAGQGYDLFFEQSKDSGGILAVSGSSVDRIRLVNQDLISEPFADLDTPISGVFSENGSTWLALLSGEIIRISQDDNFQNRYDLGLSDDEQINQIGELNRRVVAATDEGLFFFNDRSGRFEPDSTFSDRDLNSKQVYRFLACGENEVWFRNDRLIKRAIRINGEWEVFTDSYRLIARGEGMEVMHCNEDGTRFFGGSRNLYHLSDPDWSYEYDFGTNITGVFVRNDSLIYGGYGDPEEMPVFDYEDNELRFQYAAASYIEPEANEYRVRLLGYDEGWSSWSAEAQKDYTFIPEGTYTFEVQGKNIYQKTGSIDRFTFAILPPWYRTSWAYLLYLMLAAGVIYSGYRIRINSILREQRIRDGIARDLHDELSSTLSSIHFFADAIESKKLNRKEENRFLDLIAKSSREAKEKISDIVWVIHTDNDEWDDLLVRCRRFAADLLDSKGITHLFETTGDFSGKPTITERKNIWLIFREILTNIARHSNAGHAEIRIGKEESRLNIRIEDNGEGFDPDAPRENGNGLENIKERARQHKGSATLESQPGEGTRWVVEVPLR